MTTQLVYRFLGFFTAQLTKHKAGNNIPEILDAYLTFIGRCLADYDPHSDSYNNIQSELFSLYRNIVFTKELQTDNEFIESFINLTREWSAHGILPELQLFAAKSKLWLKKIIRRAPFITSDNHTKASVNKKSLLKLSEHAAAEFCHYSLKHLQMVGANPWTIPNILRLYIDFFDQALASNHFIEYLNNYETELEIQFHQLTPALETSQSRSCLKQLLADPTFKTGILERSDLTSEAILSIQNGLVKIASENHITSEDIEEFKEEILPLLNKYGTQKHDSIISICIKLFKNIMNDPALSFDRFDQYYEKALQSIAKIDPSLSNEKSEKILNKAMNTPTGRFLTGDILEELESNDVDEYELYFCAELRNLLTSRFLTGNHGKIST